MQQRLPDSGAAILKQFADTYHRVPTSQETRELATQITQDTAYEVTYKSVKKWFYRRRDSLNLEVAGIQGRKLSHRMSASGSKGGRVLQKMARIQSGDIVVSPHEANKTIGNGGGRGIPAEGIAVLKKFATDYGHYPTAAEKKELVEQVWTKSGFQTTVETLKRWFSDHRDEFSLKTVVDSRRELLLKGTTSAQSKQASRNPKKGRLTIRLPPRPLSSPQHKLHTISIVSSAEPSTSKLQDHPLSSAHIKEALQMRSGQFPEECVITACAESRAVNKHLIEDWLQGDQSDYAPPAPTSPCKSTPISFLTPPIDRTAHGQAHLAMPRQSHSATLSDQPTLGRVPDDTEMEAMGTSAQLAGDAMVTSLTDSAPATDLFVSALAEAVRKSISSPPISNVKPMECTEFKALWPSFTHLAGALGAM